MALVQSGAASAAHTRPVAVRSGAVPGAEDRVLIEGVSWAQYDALVAILGDERPCLRLAFLRGSLEIMSPSRVHETLKSMLGRLVTVYAMERGLDLAAFGSTTFRARAKERGIEPDECFVLGARSRVDAPDLAIEVAISPWRVDRFALYHGLGVRELWVWHDGRLGVYLRGVRRYAEVRASRLLPDLDLRLVSRLAVRRDQTAALLEMRRALAPPRKRP